MQNSNKYPKDEVISVLKEWASPVLIGIVGMLLWRDVTEMRADVKLLLTQQSADRVKIEQLETDVDMLKNYIFIEQQKAKPSQNTDHNPFSRESQARYPAIVRQEDYYSKNKKRK